jgi:hypothetical protein
MIEFLKDLLDFMRERRKFWMTPLIGVLLLVGLLVLIAQFTPVAPFIYTLF